MRKTHKKKQKNEKSMPAYGKMWSLIVENKYLNNNQNSKLRANSKMPWESGTNPS